jgi:hypothetical protein
MSSKSAETGTRVPETARHRRVSQGDVPGRSPDQVNVELAEEADDSDDSNTFFTERLWIFQCKREKALPPRKLRTVITDSLRSFASAPHGFVLAVGCVVSEEARGAFRAEMARRGVEEFLLWATSELEDMRFQPQHDRLLFAYFGISLQPRRRSIATRLRADLTKKKQREAVIGPEGPDGTLVLLRDPADERNPELSPDSYRHRAGFSVVPST